MNREYMVCGALFNHGTRVPSREQQRLTENSFLLYNSLSFITEPRRSNSYRGELCFPLASRYSPPLPGHCILVRGRIAGSLFVFQPRSYSSSPRSRSDGDRGKCDSGIQTIADDEQFQTWGPVASFPGSGG